MLSMNPKISVMVLFILLLIPVTSALDAVPAYSTTCINSSHIQKIANITDRQDGSKILDSSQDVACPYGCDQDRDICHKWPANALSGEYFIIFQIIALLLMFIVLWRIDLTSDEVKVFDVAVTVISMVLFTLLALQGNNVIDLSTGEGIPMIMVVWLDFGLSLLMLMLFFFNVFKFARAVTDEGSKI